MAAAPAENFNRYLDELRLLLTNILSRSNLSQCLAIITDDLYCRLFDKAFFDENPKLQMNMILKISDMEDLGSPNYQTVRVLKEMRTQKCDMHFVLLSNGLQMKRLWMFITDNRILDTGAKFVLLFDYRLFEKDMKIIWKNVLNIIFLEPVANMEGQFRVSTTPSPNINTKFVVKKELAVWKRGRFTKKVTLFQERIKDFKGHTMRIVVNRHDPMVSGSKGTDFVGLEVEIILALSKVLNFKADFYEPINSQTELWGRLLPNGSYTGVLGEMVQGNAELAIGDLYNIPLLSAVMDMSVPHSQECLTFLTPESSQDNTWKTLILPFSGIMWACVGMVQIGVGMILYIMSYFYERNMGQGTRKLLARFPIFPKHGLRSTHFRDAKASPARLQTDKNLGKAELFDTLLNCMLMTLSMSLYVTLPRLPKNWPLRILIGWYWIYSIMLTVAYRASFFAILAKPSPRTTINTIQELAQSDIVANVWGEENKKFFEEAFDDDARAIAEHIEVVNNIEGITEQISQGYHAYYDNEHFLRSLRRCQGKSETKILHVMSECIVYMPIGIGMEKNSPLKEKVNRYIYWMRSGGLIKKWLDDTTQNLSNEETPPAEALMDFSKFWSSLIALSCGYFLSLLAAICEKLHFKYVVLRHPLYDELMPKMYYVHRKYY